MADSPTPEELAGRIAALETLVLGVACACLPVAFPEKKDLELAIGGISASIINNAGTRYGHKLANRLTEHMTQMLAVAASPEAIEELMQPKEEQGNDRRKSARR